MKYLKNISGEDLEIPDVGIIIKKNDTYLIQSQDYALFQQSENTVWAIYTGKASVSGDDGYVMSKRVGIALIQSNSTILNEFYTLVNEDAVLMGNGQILYLDDAMGSVLTIPEDLNDFIEDDK